MRRVHVVDDACGVEHLGRRQQRRNDEFDGRRVVERRVRRDCLDCGGGRHPVDAQHRGAEQGRVRCGDDVDVITERVEMNGVQMKADLIEIDAGMAIDLRGEAHHLRTGVVVAESGEVLRSCCQ